MQSSQQQPQHTLSIMRPETTHNTWQHALTIMTLAMEAAVAARPTSE
jgi:hypothetical protein